MGVDIARQKDRIINSRHMGRWADRQTGRQEDI